MIHIFIREDVVDVQLLSDHTDGTLFVELGDLQQIVLGPRDNFLIISRSDAIFLNIVEKFKFAKIDHILYEENKDPVKWLLT